VPTIRAGAALTLGRVDSSIHSDGFGCDLSNLAFIDTFGLVAATVVLLGPPSGWDPEFSPPHLPQVSEHLAYMGLAKVLDDAHIPNGLPDRNPAEYEDVVAPLAVVEDVSAVDSISHLLFAQLESRVDPQVLVALSEALWELAANALEHSGAPAIIAGQVYRAGDPPDHDDKVQVVIGDSGRGIRASFVDGGTHQPQTDREAIELAVEYLTSSVPDPGRGQGLYTTIAETETLNGLAVVRSGNARLNAQRAGRTLLGVPRLPGTIVSLPIRPTGLATRR